MFIKTKPRRSRQIVVFARVFEKKSGGFMFEVDPLWISEYDLHTKLEDSYTAFPYSIRPSRNVSDVMDPMAIPY